MRDASLKGLYRMWFHNREICEWQIYGGSEMISGAGDLRKRERWDVEPQGVFRAVKLYIYCVMLSRWTYDITHLSKPIKFYSTKSSL